MGEQLERLWGLLNRHEAEGPRGCELAAGSNTQGPVLIKERGGGWGGSVSVLGHRGEMNACYASARTWMFDGKNIPRLVDAYNAVGGTGSMLHWFTHSGNTGGVGSSFRYTPALLQPFRTESEGD